MFNALITKLFGSKNEREMRRMLPLVEQVASLEPEVEALSDDQLRGRTAEFRGRLDQGAGLDDILPEAFATVREAGRRTLSMRHFDVQIIGGMVLHRGRIAEMKTGEGKTLVATLPVYLNALAGQGVHVVTVNDYLAGRDAEWMGRLYRFLGLSVGCIKHDMNDQQRREAYGADVTYGTNNEFGFDYLRDNMKFTLDGMVQRGHHYAIVDEVDSILIDEARTPLIISGPSEGDVEKYYAVNKIIPRLNKGAVIAGDAPKEERASLEASGDYVIDEKGRSVTMTERGVAHAEKLLGVGNLYDPANIDVLHAVNQALRAHSLFRRDVDYLVEQGEVVIIDEFTGRKMPGRRWSDGLHQAVEAKEGVRIERENQTLATVTFQNYFRMYDKLAGMTGTADTEAPEFAQIYDLDVSVIPTNRSLIRVEHPDVIYKTEKEKLRNAVEEIREINGTGQPILVGTISIENSEKLSAYLKRAGIAHEVLNAKHHAREADIVAQAGRLGAVTIATNMAGRGTDILLGGNAEALARSRVREKGEGDWEEAEEETRRAALEEAEALCGEEHEKVVELGGLHILGTERHEARRIDNQLRGRAGRQGDPGSSRFYLSIEDDLMRRFAGDRLEKVMNFLKLEEDVPIEDRMVTRAISRAQKQVEAQNFSIRKHLLDYDDVMNKQRIEIYRLRGELLAGGEQKEYVLGKAADLLDWLIQEHLPEDKDPGDWKVDELESAALHYYGIDTVKEGLNLRELGTEEISEALGARIEARYEAKEERVGAELMRQHERFVILQIIDSQWKDHLLTMDHLKEGISLRAYGQRDPLMEYKRESFELFGEMKDRIEDEVVRYLMLLEPMTREERAAEEARRRREQEMIFEAASRAKAGEKRKPVQNKTAKVGRNAPCPCGSGKKYKKCHGAAAS